MEVEIEGFCHPDFTPVREVFSKKMHEDGIGAAVSLVSDGEIMVDLWGGDILPHRTRRWQKDTIVMMTSVSKAIGNLCVLKLIDQGKIDPENPLALYWPEFAQAGKEKVSVRCVLSHLAGLPFAETASPGSIFEDYDSVVQAIAAQKPTWEPGTTPCYHSFTIGPIYSEIVKRVSGKNIGQFLHDEITGPLDIDYQFGLRPEDEDRYSQVKTLPNTPTLDAIFRNPDSFLARAWRPVIKEGNPFPEKDADFLYNHPGLKKIELPCINGFGNARSIARLYGILTRSGEEGVGLLKKETLEDSIQESWSAVEKISNRHFRFGMGFMLSNPVLNLGPNPRNFGFPGLGGSIGFGDPDKKIGFGFCCNLLAATGNSSPTDALVESMYSCLK